METVDFHTAGHRDCTRWTLFPSRLPFNTLLPGTPHPTDRPSLSIFQTTSLRCPSVTLQASPSSWLTVLKSFDPVHIPSRLEALHILPPAPTYQVVQLAKTFPSLLCIHRLPSRKSVCSIASFAIYPTISSGRHLIPSACVPRQHTLVTAHHPIDSLVRPSCCPTGRTATPRALIVLT